MLIYWKIRVSRNNLQVSKVWFLITLFNFSSITYHLSSILSNNYNNVFTPVWSSCSYSDNSWSCSRREATIYCIVYYQINIRIIKWRYNIPVDSVFTFDKFGGSLGTSIFGNSSSAAINTRSRLPSRLSFRFLWPCNHSTRCG